MFGLSTPLLYLIAGIAILGALAGLYATIDGRGYSRGQAEVETRYQARDNAALAEATARIQALQTAAREQEQAKAKAVAGISTRFQKELENAKVRNALLDADVRAGRLRLRDPGAASPAVCGRGSTSQVAAPAARSDGAAGGELPVPPVGVLSRDATDFLIGLASQADAVVAQLGACQALVMEDRK